MQSWPATLMEFWSWHVEAACGAVDISLFYSPEGERGPRKARQPGIQEIEELQILMKPSNARV